MSNVTIDPVKPGVVRDVYRFGDGPEPVLQPGTMGWCASDFDEPGLRRLWDDGRYEILDGVLTVMPAVYFLGGECAGTLQYILRNYLQRQKVSAAFSNEVDIQISQKKLLRADGVAVFGEELPRFRALEFSEPGDNWRKHPLTIPPTLVIESVGQGHELHDRQSKLRQYAEFGVKHYWIVDGFGKSLDCLLLQDGKYISEAAGSNADELALKSLEGLTISLKDLWGD